ncbi:MAG: hypothetical protein AB1705_22605 [Verrucomicrobiota bacterium]
MVVALIELVLWVGLGILAIQWFLKDASGSDFWIRCAILAGIVLYKLRPASPSREPVATNLSAPAIPSPPPGTPPGESYFDEQRRAIVLPGADISTPNSLAQAGNVFFGFVLTLFGLFTGFIAESKSWKTGGFAAVAVGLICLSNTLGKRVDKIIELDSLSDDDRKKWDEEAKRLLEKQRQRDGLSAKATTAGQAAPPPLEPNPPLGIPPPPAGTPAGEPYFDEERRILVAPSGTKAGSSELSRSGTVLLGLAFLATGAGVGLMADSGLWKAGGALCAIIGFGLLSGPPPSTRGPLVIVMDELPEQHRKVWDKEVARLIELQRQRQQTPPRVSQ